MGFNLTEANGQVQYNVNEYFIDSEEDLRKLPPSCAMGSRAICIEDGRVFVKKSNGQWKEL